ncbi:hypothetical protein JNO63_06645 [Anaerococcus sp. mt242]|uniref:hypothetical protein n=1 Tax=Anaerococcus sp. mt242 TaxID=2661917 RepID=UPI0019330746|nr:hypothetical protein [Anaerococcus sp. mt242]MBM0046768.1 hypothetical protein [Anaerococcus sp. mt242]
MDISKNINKIVNILFYICLVSILTITAGDSFLLLASIPIIFSAIGLDKGIGEFLIVFASSFLIGLIFGDIKQNCLFFIPILILSLIQIGLIKSNLSDKYQIVINFALASLLFIGIYKYQMITENISIADMANEMKEAFSSSLEYDIPDRVYETSFALYPSILSGLAMLYSLFSLKIVRNYLAYKNKGEDIKNLNTIRLSKSNFITLIAICLVIYFVLSFVLSVPVKYIGANLIAIVIIFLILNGILTYDYLTMRRAGVISRGMRWFFIIMFFYFFMFIFILLGISDIFVDFRKKIRRIDEK